MRRKRRKRKRRQDMKILGGYPGEGTVDLSQVPKGPAPGGEPIPQDGDVQPSAAS